MVRQTTARTPRATTAPGLPVLEAPGRNVGAGTRERILRAAARLYTERGYALASIREIAARAQVTKPVIYYYFESKQDLYATLLRQVLEEIEAAFEAELARPASTVRRLKAVIDAHVRCCLEDPDLARFAYEVFSFPGVLPLGFDYHALGHRIFGRIEGLIREGQRQGEFRRADAVCAVMMLTGALNLYVAAHLNQVEPELTPRTASSLSDLLLRGLTIGRAR